MDDNLISIINELQDAFAASASSTAPLHLDLPQIAVVGSQSAGKSSVLENIVGKDFLPRGQGIVTRRPLNLQLVHTRKGGEEYGEFLHLPGRRFYNFEEIRSEIQAETDRLTGTNKGISPIPISLRLSSPRLLDLSLVDLPGIAKIPVGDQPHDIETQIRAMVQSYIERPNCLILAVTPANTDLATSDALQMALEFDPEGERTIGVLTKLDLLEKGTDASEILLNKVFRLRYGYVGVVNRSQRDIDGRKDIAAALQSERAFFLGHHAYRGLTDCTGTECLRKQLSFHLTRHIADSIPDLKLSLTRRLGTLEAELSGLRLEYDYEDPHWKPKTLLLLAIKFAEHFRIELLGNADFHLSVDSLSTGARISCLFHKHYPHWLLSTEFTQEAIMKQEIGFIIQNVLGVRPGLFTPDKAFDLVVQKQILKLKPPTVMLIDKISDELEEGLKVAAAEMTAFPALEAEVVRRGRLSLAALTDRARAHAEQIIDFEHAYINTKHEDFVGFSYAEQKAYSRVLKRRDPGAMTKHSGWLALNTGFGKSRQKFWFVLTLDNLSWFTDESLKERVYMIPMDEGLQFRDPMSSNRLVLFSPEGKNIFRDKPQLDLQAPSIEALEGWKKNFIQVGVFTNESGTVMLSEPATVSQKILDVSDPALERQIESLWILVDSYMRIVCRTLLDVVPKCIVKMLIKDSVYHFEKNLVSELSRIYNVDELMEEDQGELERKKSLEKSVQSCRTALQRLRDINLPAVSKRPPVRNRVKPPATGKTIGLNRESAASTGWTAPGKSGGNFATNGAVSPKVKPKVPERPDVSQKKIGTAKPLPRSAPSRKSSQEMKKALQAIDSSGKSTFY